MQLSLCNIFISKCGAIKKEIENIKKVSKLPEVNNKIPEMKITLDKVDSRLNTEELKNS